jgi:hypothetical protein
MRFGFQILYQPLIVAISCAWFFMPSSCLNDDSDAALRVEQSIADLDLSVADRYLIGKVVVDILQLFNPEQYIYVFLGRSPTPFHAFFASIEPLVAKLKFTSIPYSAAAGSKSWVELEGVVNSEGRDKRDLFQKMITHFDLYLGDWLTEELERDNPRRIVIIDYTQSGRSLGEAKRQIDFYLHHIAGKEKKKEAFRRLKTEYLALADNVRGLKETIDSHKMPYHSAVSGIRWLKNVGADGTFSSSLVNIPRRVDRLNKSLLQSWHWEGEIIDLNAYTKLPQARETKLLQLIRQQKFDAYSLHGGWYLALDNLDVSPRINPQFFDLVDSVRFGCSYGN